MVYDTDNEALNDPIFWFMLYAGMLILNKKENLGFIFLLPPLVRREVKGLSELLLLLCLLMLLLLLLQHFSEILIFKTI